MTTEELRIAVAENAGFVWYKQRNGVIDASDYWGETRLAYPPEEGIAFPGCKGTVSETRFCTPEEIELAKSTVKYNGLSIPEYTTSRDACWEGWEKDAPDAYWTYLAAELDIEIYDTDRTDPHGQEGIYNWFVIIQLLKATPEQRCQAMLKWKGREV